MPSPSAQDLEALLDCYRSGTAKEWIHLSTGMRKRYAVSAELRSRSYLARLRQDLSWLGTTGALSFPLRMVLDVGSGSNPDVHEIVRLTDADTYIAIDPELETSRNSFLSLDEFRETQPGVADRCLVMIRVTLHHLVDEQQRKMLIAIASLIGPNSCLFIVEDSPDSRATQTNICLECFTACAQWRNLSESQRFELLSINDIWTNCIAYGRAPKDLCLSFHIERDWSMLLKESGFRVIETVTTGFNHERLHCVPSLRLIAELRDHGH